MKDKPSLDDLFQSKKLDLPSEDFWNGFQDRVKGRAIASLGERSKTARLRKASVYAALPALVLSLIGWNLLRTDTLNSEIALSTADSSENSSLANLVALVEEDHTFEREGVMQLARLDSFDSFTSTRFEMAGASSNFNHYLLTHAGEAGLRNPSQFTF